MTVAAEPDVRLRANFMGQLVVQVRYPVLVSTSYIGPGTFVTEGVGEWRDARASDDAEVASVTAVLSRDGS